MTGLAQRVSHTREASVQALSWLRTCSQILCHAWRGAAFSYLKRSELEENMKNIVVALLVVLVGSLAACGGAGAETGKETTPGQSAAGGDMEAVCRDSFARQRTCTDDFIPALVDARIELDMPAGIAAEGKKEGGRDALIKQAKEEWSKDSEPTAVAAQCKDMSEKMPVEQKAEVSGALSQCLASSDCGSYVKCVTPVTKKMLSARK